MVSARIACLLVTLAILCAPYVPSSAQNQESIFERIRLEHDEIEKSAHQQDVIALSSLIASSVESQSIDVKHYRLQIQLIPNEFSTAGVITGAVTITITGGEDAPVLAAASGAASNRPVRSASAPVNEVIGTPLVAAPVLVMRNVLSATVGWRSTR